MVLRGGSGHYEGNIFSGNTEVELLIEWAVSPAEIVRNRFHCQPTTDPRNKKADIGIRCVDNTIRIDHNDVEGYRIGLWLHSVTEDTVVCGRRRAQAL